MCVCVQLYASRETLFGIVTSTVSVGTQEQLVPLLLPLVKALCKNEENVQRYPFYFSKLKQEEKLKQPDKLREGG